MVFCSRLCRQLGLLIWKNFVLQIRRPIGTVFELILPTLAVVFIIVLKFTIFNNQREDRCFVTFDSDHLTIPSPFEFPPFLTQTYQIYYTPNNSNASEIMGFVESSLPSAATANSNIIGFSSEEEMVATLQNLTRLGLPGCFAGGAGIVFDNLEGPDMEYTIRLRHDVGSSDSWNTRRAAAAFNLPGPRVEPNLYLSEGFLHIQNLVGKAIVRWRAQVEGVTFPDVDVSVRQLPYPEYTQDLFLSAIGNFLPLLLIMAFLYSAGITVKELVLEKELRIRESMMMMGLQEGTLWTSWYIKQFVFLFVSVITISILLKFGQAFPQSDLALLLIFFTLFVTSMISFSFFVSVWFSSARIGLIVGFVAWFVNYLPVLFLGPRYDDLPLGGKVGSCVLSNTCMGLGVQVLSIMELRGDGLLWSNFAQPLSSDDSFSMIHIFAMLLLDTVVYMLLAWYINGVKPGTYGVPKPWYFPCLPSYWTGRARRSADPARKELHDGLDDADYSAHEEVTNPPEVGIRIQNLTKIYGQSIFSRIVSRKQGSARLKAVDNLSLDMYKGQITALLGHNGAGKTTTMSILTGLYTPSSGNATINGYSILTDMDQIRSSLGICPQHNVLFDRLTVREHLKFFMKLKGSSGNVNAEVDSMITDLQLEDKRNIQASRLSGGMKRKLSVGIALVGGSEVIILDEPTSGMDPYARRATWDLLAKHKQDRTVLLTTHFMDEADLLGDRIAIMAEGKLRCSGSSLFLKSRYGIGYHMTIVKSASCDPAQIASLIRSKVPTAEQVTDVGAELTFILPSDATPSFPDLFDSLEARKQELGIDSFGVSVTTMEEVFMKVGEDSDAPLDQRLRGTSASVKRETETAPTTTVTDVTDVADVTFANEGAEEARVEILKEETALTYKYAPNSGLMLWIQQFCAMFLKRVYNSMRFWAAIIAQLVLPLGFVLFGMILAVALPSLNEDDPSRTLGLSNSAASSDNVSLFYAQFAESSNSTSFNFSEIQPSWLGATNLLDYYSQVQSIIDRVNASLPNTVQDCCQYKHQILDGFCASRSKMQLQSQCGSVSDFGYNRCTRDCLSCCTATSESSSLQSCSAPGSLFGSRNSRNFCPAPPKLSLSDSSSSGLLDNENVFVAEHILTLAAQTQPFAFFRQIQAGITIAKRDPPISVCGCSGSTSREQVCDFFSPYTKNDSIQCQEYGFEEPSCATVWTACLNNLKFGPIDSCSFLQGECRSLSSNTPNICSSNTTLSNCYTVEGLSADVLKRKACNTKELTRGCNNEQANNRPIFTTYVDQEPEFTATVWYNNQPFHMPGAALNAFHNVLLRKATDGDTYRLTVNNHPLPRNLSVQIEDASRNFTGFSIGILVVFGFSFLLASFAIFLVKEKESKAKHLQFVSGVFPSSYWLATFAWDLLNALIPVLVSLIIFAAFQVEAFSGEGLAAIFILLLLTCWASIPFTYVFSFLFTNSLAAFGLLVLLFFFVAMLTLTVVFLVQLNVGTTEADVIHYIFLIFPTYGLSVGFNDLYSNQAAKSVCSQPGAEVFCANNTLLRYVDNPFDLERPGIGVVLLYMVVEGFLLMWLTLLIERRFFYPELRGLLHKRINKVQDRKLGERSPLSEDEDVSDERRKVSSGLAEENDVVVINNLRKTYRARLSGCSIKPSKKAVRGISLAIPAGECFGLLGVNGAGKTTTFGVITGDLSMTSGSVSVAGYDIQSNLRDVQQRIGYCPQFDALIERLTGRELLTMFARLRGVPEKQIKAIVNTEITRVDLKKHADKKCGSYSGGNKRKLSTAIALVGNPPIVMLDEPTTGMDPTTRRYTWDVLTGVIKEGRSIILTSHSMEECEALCTRIAIMVNGHFKCLGNIQHLKNKFGTGLILQAKIGLIHSSISQSSLHVSVNRGFKDAPAATAGSTHNTVVEVEVDLERSTPTPETIGLRGGRPNEYNTTSLHIFIRESFSGAVLLEEHQGAVTYQLPSGAFSWSSVFRLLENNKERLGIVDYSVSQTTLEQVFINFAKEQTDNE